MLMGVPYEPLIYKAASKVAKVKNVILTDGGCNYFHAVVQIEKETEEDARRVIEAAFQAHGSLKHVLVVDADIDIYDPRDLEFAIATRMRADEDLVIHPNVRGSTLDPRSVNGHHDQGGCGRHSPAGAAMEVSEGDAKRAWLEVWSSWPNMFNLPTPTFY